MTLTKVKEVGVNADRAKFLMGTGRLPEYGQSKTLSLHIPDIVFSSWPSSRHHVRQMDSLVYLPNINYLLSISGRDGRQMLETHYLPDFKS